MDAHPVVEEHEDQLADAVGGNRLAGSSAPSSGTSRDIWLTLQRLRELYALQSGKMEPLEAKELADRLQKSAEESRL